ncbi:MAG: hypothetical protein AAF829_05440 [Pseudomonadota bacterium]
MPKRFEMLDPESFSAVLLDYVKGRLSSEEARAVDLYIAGSQEAAAELAYYQGLARAAHDDTNETVFNELGWARLERALPPQHSPRDAGRGNQSIWSYAAAALGLCVVVQGALLIERQNTPPEEAYVTATAEGTGYDVVVAFSPSATEAEISMLLNRVEGEMSAGPSALGLYVVRFETAAARNTGLVALDDATGIVESASEL